MKIIIMMIAIYGFFFQSVFAQNRKQGTYRKVIENNYYFLSQNERCINFNSKGNVEKLFFGDLNAFVEFAYLSSGENAFYRAPCGFRIIQNSSNILEVKYISNYSEAAEKASKIYPAINSGSEWSNMTDKDKNQIIEHNRATFAKRNELIFEFFKIETLSFSVSKQLSNKLYEKMSSLINGFKPNETPTMILDGHVVVFRNVVEDEVWSLNIHQPQGNAGKMADICTQIIRDALDGHLDESKYLESLDSISQTAKTRRE